MERKGEEDSHDPIHAEHNQIFIFFFLFLLDVLWLFRCVELNANVIWNLNIGEDNQLSWLLQFLLVSRTIFHTFFLDVNLYGFLHSFFISSSLFFINISSELFWKTVIDEFCSSICKTALMKLEFLFRACVGGWNEWKKLNEREQENAKNCLIRNLSCCRWSTLEVLIILECKKGASYTQVCRIFAQHILWNNFQPLNTFYWISFYWILLSHPKKFRYLYFPLDFTVFLSRKKPLNYPTILWDVCFFIETF